MRSVLTLHGLSYLDIMQLQYVIQRSQVNALITIVSLSFKQFLPV